MTRRLYDQRFVDFLAGLDDYAGGEADTVEIEDVPRSVRDAFEEDQQNRREWDGDLSE